MIGGIAMLEGGKKRWMKVIGQYRNLLDFPRRSRFYKLYVGVKDRVLGCC
jgi:hypothetical protein